MPLSPGTRLGSYQILSPIGAGGMGEVYRAKDTKLKREVAVKVLPETFARDPERMARFQREAEMLAALNHPNIAAIYGFESNALIMELVEGETLSRSLPMDVALGYAKQIAEALEYAHERGVIHRDLKPANVKVTHEGVVKLLDFGLAKAIENPAAPSEDPMNSPTLTLGMTAVGMILGTAAYMSPEQASGRIADRRADIWSFGAVLYEMLSGKRAFDGDSASDTLASVLKLDPDWNALPAATPAPIRTLVRRCLKKDRKQRLQAIGEARIAIDEVLTGGWKEEVATPAVEPRRRILPWVAAACALAILAGAGWWKAWQPTMVAAPFLRLSVDLGPNAAKGGNLTAAISPDGTRLAFFNRQDDKTLLATRLLNDTQVTLLPGTEGAVDPFFSPNGEWIGFFAGGQMKKVSVRGSAVIVLCNAREGRGASWGEDGNIIATLDSDSGVGLSRIADKGGDPQFITNPREKGEATHRWPQILPGGEEVLFTANKKAATYDESNIDVLSLKTGQVKVVLSGGYYARYLGSSTGSGYLVYIRQGTLFGVPFDLDHQEIRGTPTPLLDDVASDSNTAGGQFDFSRNGTFVYLSGKGATGTWNLAWLDSNGKTEPFSPAAGLFYQPRFSPDGKRLAFSNGTDIEVYDWARGTLDRLNFRGPATNFFPVWTPDGKSIVFQSQGPGSWSLQWMRADGTGEAQPLYTAKNRVTPYSFSTDGKRVAFAEQMPDTGWDLLTLQLDTTDSEHPKARQPEPFLHTVSDEQSPALSPDGHWLAYESNESARNEIYVRPFPPGSGKTTISIGGGSRARWSRDGRELFYLAADHRIMIAAFNAKGEAEKPHQWVSTQVDVAANAYGLDRTPDGKRFVVAQLPPGESTGDSKGSVHITFLLNFLDEVRRRIPLK